MHCNYVVLDDSMTADVGQLPNLRDYIWKLVSTNQLIIRVRTYVLYVLYVFVVSHSESTDKSK